MKSFYNQQTEEVLKDLSTSENGISQTEANERLTKYGENKLKEGKKKSVIARFFAQFKDVMIILLLISAVISLVFSFIGDGKSELID